MGDRDEAMQRRIAERASELTEGFGLFKENRHPRGRDGKWVAGVAHGLHEFHVEGKAVGGVHETPKGIHGHYAGKTLHDTQARVGRDHKYPWKRFKSVKDARKAVEQEHSYTKTTKTSDAGDKADGKWTSAGSEHHFLVPKLTVAGEHKGDEHIATVKPGHDGGWVAHHRGSPVEGGGSTGRKYESAGQAKRAIESKHREDLKRHRKTGQDIAP